VLATPFADIVHDNPNIVASRRHFILLAPSPLEWIDLPPAEWTAILLSLRIAVTATVVSLPVGILTAYALARWHFPGKTVLNGVVHLPLVLPPVVTGFLLLVLLGRKGVFGPFLASIGIVLSFRWTGAAVACAVMAFPLMVRAIRLSFESIDRRLELAAGTLGAGPLAKFFLISLPLATPGIAAGAILAFAKALGEFGATITFVSNIPGETQTISAAIYSYTQTPGGDESAMRLTLIAIAISFAALAASEIFQRQAEKRRARF
jgi:molybdate transport system permease protein